MINVALAPVHAYTIYHHHVLVSLFLFASCFAAPCAILLVAVVEAVLLVRRFMVVVAAVAVGAVRADYCGAVFGTISLLSCAGVNLAQTTSKASLGSSSLLSTGELRQAEAEAGGTGGRAEILPQGLEDGAPLDKASSYSWPVHPLRSVRLSEVDDGTLLRQRRPGKAGRHPGRAFSISGCAKGGYEPNLS